MDFNKRFSNVAKILDLSNMGLSILLNGTIQFCLKNKVIKLFLEYNQLKKIPKNIKNLNNLKKFFINIIK